MHLEELYQTVILDHAKRPRNYGPLPEPCQKVQGDNPLCGDEVTLHLKMNGEDRIEALKFEGQGCAISQASASLMTVKLKGKSRQEALQLLDTFHSHLTGENPAPLPESYGDLLALAGVKQFPQRVKCATLSWNALRTLLTETKD
ncbi:MAG: SUF system NifU family Fe-S cluster assembly protein [Blastochloris sp.]|nr:SUF system NifU family Fe-S cluster assembly protein [Blastochloris sp.]